jgi:hypothetical protein
MALIRRLSSGPARLGKLVTTRPAPAQRHISGRLDRSNTRGTGWRAARCVPLLYFFRPRTRARSTPVCSRVPGLQMAGRPEQVRTDSRRTSP